MINSSAYAYLLTPIKLLKFRHNIMIKEEIYMKIMRIFAWMLMLTLLMQSGPYVSAVANNNDTEVVVENMEKNRMIDELFALRMSLEHDYEANRDEIDEIDRQLSQLGVETLSAEDVANLYGVDGVAPLWEPESTPTIRWTSRKLITTYRGYHFEVQILEGVPISGNSPLRKNYTQVNYSARGITAGVTKAIVATSSNAFSEFLMRKLSTGVTFLSMLSDGMAAIQESLSTSTVLDRVEGAAVISFSGHMKYIYVKPYETSDAEYQGLYYYGNSVSCIITTVSIVDTLIDNQLVTYHEVETSVQDTIQSQYYNDYSRAVANYWDYNYNYNTNFKQDYTSYYLNLNILGNNNLYALPWATHPSIIYD